MSIKLYGARVATMDRSVVFTTNLHSVETGEPEKMLNLYAKVRTGLESLRDERGQDLIEYALLAALIAVACVAAISPVAAQINAVFANVAAAF
jgi:pilus assembly protein Flp/PilA